MLKKAATAPTTEVTKFDRESMFRSVVAPGYVRRIRNRLGKLIDIVLPDLEYQVSVCCGHMKREGLHPRCQCKVEHCPCRWSECSTVACRPITR